MIAIAPIAASALMHALLSKIDEGAVLGVRSGAIELYGGARPIEGGVGGIVGTPVAKIALDVPCGQVIETTGVLVLSSGQKGQMINSSTPRWARIVSAQNEVLFAVDVRLRSEMDMHQELVIAVDEVYVGAFVAVDSAVIAVM